MKRILYVEDNQDFRLFLQELLELQGYEVIAVDHAMAGVREFKQNVFDLVISDVKMEPIDGFQLLYLLREIDDQAKIVLLTSSEDEEDELNSLDLNANDFIRKSSSMKVLLKRIEKMLYLHTAIEKEELRSTAEDLVVYLKSRRVMKEDEEIQLTQKEFELLVLFLKNKNTVMSRERIIKEVWKIKDEFVELRIIDTHIKKLRKKLFLSCLFSIRGVGYEWIE